MKGLGEDALRQSIQIAELLFQRGAQGIGFSQLLFQSGDDAVLVVKRQSWYLNRFHLAGRNMRYP